MLVQVHLRPHGMPGREAGGVMGWRGLVGEGRCVDAWVDEVGWRVIGGSRRRDRVVGRGEEDNR